MKALKSFIVLVILFASFYICLGQDSKTDLVLFDSVSEMNCEVLLAVMDYHAVKTLKNADSVGFVVLYGGENPIENHFVERFLKSYLYQRDKNRFKILTAKSDDKIKVEFWIGKNEKEPTVNQLKFDYKLKKSSKPILFVQDSVEVA